MSTRLWADLAGIARWPLWGPCDALWALIAALTAGILHLFPISKSEMPLKRIKNGFRSPRTSIAQNINKIKKKNIYSA